MNAAHTTFTDHGTSTIRYISPLYLLSGAAAVLLLLCDVLLFLTGGLNVGCDIDHNRSRMHLILLASG